MRAVVWRRTGVVVPACCGKSSHHAVVEWDGEKWVVTSPVFGHNPTAEVYYCPFCGTRLEPPDSEEVK